MLNDIIWIGAGGFLGANARYLLSTWIARTVDPTLPWGTVTVNALGSMIIGAFLFWAGERIAITPDLRLFVAVGFCGSFTTFSSFAFETIHLFEQGHWLSATGNIFLNNILALAAVLAGMALMKWATS